MTMVQTRGTRVSSSASSVGSTVGIVFLIFLFLKLVGVIHWSWWWVASPLWIGVAAFVAFVVLGGLGYAAYRLIQRVRRRGGA